MTAQYGGRTSDFSEKATDQLKTVSDRVEELAGTATRQARHVAGDATERVGEVAGNVKVAVEKSLRDQPMATLAMAAALGFVLGALWKS
jgi:ElaB/YqjD/DUF883 family membrane-anchored ribosome-binding protein